MSKRKKKKVERNAKRKRETESKLESKRVRDCARRIHNRAFSAELVIPKHPDIFFPPSFSTIAVVVSPDLHKYFAE